MITIRITLLLVTAITTGLTAGLLYSYACSINPGLGQVPDETYLRAMQSINRAILNPVFFLSFMGTLFLLPATTLLHAGHPGSLRFLCLLGASVLYIGGVIGVTALGNIPLNKALDAFNISSATAQQMADQRAAFETPWNNLHLVRTWASIIALALVIIACLRPVDQ